MKRKRIDQCLRRGYSISAVLDMTFSRENLERRL